MALKKRGRGRPRKEPVVENDEVNSQLDEYSVFEHKSNVTRSSDEEFELGDDDSDYEYKALKLRKVSKNKRGRPPKKETAAKSKLVKNKKKILREDTDDSNADLHTKYKPGKFPAETSSFEEEKSYDRTTPLDSDSELWRDRDAEPWDIPDFKTQIFDTIEKYVWKRGGEDNLQFFKDFIRWPSRKFYPEYYHKITIDDCISLKDIQKRSYITSEENAEATKENSDALTSTVEIYNYEQLILDIDKIYKNCVFYNEEDTLIVRAAYQLSNLIKLDILKLKNEYRNFEINQYLKKSIETKVLKKLEKVTEKIMFEELEKNSKSFTKPKRQLDTSLKLIEPFLDLVPEAEFPDYYQLIYKPISFKMITSNLKSGFYKTLYDFYLDIELLFFNCKAYNPSESLLHIDATHLLLYSRIIFGELVLELEEYNKEHSLSLYKPYQDAYMRYKNNLLRRKSSKAAAVSGANENPSLGGHILEDGWTTHEEQQPLPLLSEEEVLLLQSGGRVNKYANYEGNLEFNDISNIIFFTATEPTAATDTYDKNQDLLSQLAPLNENKEQNTESCFSNLKLTFFQDYRFGDKNMTNINLNDFEKIYSTSTKIKETSHTDNKGFELYHYNLINSKPSNSYTYSLKNPLTGSKNLYTHLELQLNELDLEYKESDSQPPYKYKCQVYFNNLVGGAPVIISPKAKADDNGDSKVDPLVCLYNIKLSQKRSFVSIIVTREKGENVDLKETINLWFNV